MRHARPTLFSFAVLLLGACSTVESRGWSGKDAVPFDSARDGCKQDAANYPAGAERDRMFEACMLSKGWSRR